MDVRIVSKLRARGLAPSVGAGGSLILAAVCCVLAVSAMLAFHGWPGREAGPGDGQLVLRTPAGKAAGRSAAGPASSAPSAARTAASTPGGASAATRRRAPRTTTARPRAVTVPVTAPAPASAGTGTTPAAAPASGGSGSGSTPAAQPAAPGPVVQVVDAGRQLAAPVTQALPAPVAQPVQRTLDTVRTVAGTVDGTLPPLP
jgi:hypothetical protein